MISYFCFMKFSYGFVTFNNPDDAMKLVKKVGEASLVFDKDF